MPRSVKRPRRIVLLAVVAVVLPAICLALYWRTYGLFHRPEADALAAAAYARGDWERTARLAHDLLRKAPDDPRGLRLAARAAARQDRDESAIAIYSRLAAVELEPEDFFLMGRALSRTGQLEPAFKAFETARAGNPDDPDTLDFLCRIDYQKDLYYAAEEAALVLAKHPEREARAQLMLGTARAELDDPAGVALALGRWLQLDPEGKAAAPDPVRPIQMLLARSLLKTARPTEARKVLEKLEEPDHDPEVSWLLSRAFIQQRDWKGAAAAWQVGRSFRAEHAAEPEPAPYVGEARCAHCHADVSRAVLASRHAATFFRARDLKNLALPKVPQADPGNPEVTHEFSREGDALRLTSRTPNRVFRAVIDYAFGSRDHFTTFVGRDDRDRSFMLRMSTYTSPEGQKWDLSTALPKRPDDEEEFLGKLLAKGDGARRCLFCHTTSFRAVRDGTGPEAADHSIGCEKCHGPGGNHLAAVDAGFLDLAIACPGHTPPAQASAICARCHGFPQPEMAAANRTDPALYRFPSVTLTWSRCFSMSNGKLSCLFCHDPHHDAEKSVELNELKCLSCHAASKDERPPGHGKGLPAHPALSAEKEVRVDGKTSCPVNPARGCLACHMPRIWQQDTHTFKTDHFIRIREGATAAK